MNGSIYFNQQKILELKRIKIPVSKIGEFFFLRLQYKKLVYFWNNWKKGNDDKKSNKKNKYANENDEKCLKNLILSSEIIRLFCMKFFLIKKSFESSSIERILLQNFI